MATMTYSGILSVISCAQCHMKFAMPHDLESELRRTHKGFFCPLGHSLVFNGPTEEQRLRSQLEAQADQLHAAEVEAEMMRAKLVQARYRYSRGVCPCCNRSFPGLARHMSTQHPEYDPGDLRVPDGYRCSCGRSFETPRGLAIHQGRARASDWTDPKRSKWYRHLTVAKS